MNAVEIEEAVSALAEQPFDPAEFPYTFLQAFGNKEATVKRLRLGDTNKSDVGGVLQRNNIHLAVAPSGEVPATLAALRDSPATAKHKAKFILATDGERLEAEELGSGEPLACARSELPDHFGFFLALAGISTVREIRENAFDIRATSKLNKLYVALLRENPEWGTDERRPDMNHFMARLIFCFFAEDTGILAETGLFTQTVAQMSARDSANTHEVISTLFAAMNTKHDNRDAAGLPRWAASFPYVNGGLFSGSMAVPRFSRTAKAYLLQVGSLDWKQVNPDIFGSMIQAVADDEERGALGMHYTSVPNILKVLNPLFLDDLRAKLEEGGTNPRTLLNLRKRISKIRVFDPACGSGNFLVIAYKEMRRIEAELNKRRNEEGRATEIPLTNFRGIELRDFAAEVARLALIIAEFQCDVLYRGQQEALNDFLPLDAENWITCGNALRLDWLSTCPPTDTSVRLVGDDLFSTPLDQSQIDFENAGGETYICGNPPYLGSVLQSPEQKAELKGIFGPLTQGWKSLDYVAGWLFKAVQYGAHTNTAVAFVATNSICQGEQVPILWPLIFAAGHEIIFAYRSFQWKNLASYNAGVTVIIAALSASPPRTRRLFDTAADGSVTVTEASNIGPYLVPGPNVQIHPRSAVPDERAVMIRGNMANDGGHLVLSPQEAESLLAAYPCSARFIRRFVGSREFIHSTPKYCVWVEDAALPAAEACKPIRERIALVRIARREGGKQARDHADTPHRFVFAPHRDSRAVVIPRVSSENREYLPVGITSADIVVSERNFVLYDAPLWNVGLIASRLHWVWIGTVCVRMRTDFSYSNTLGWNTFPLPTLTTQNKADLTECAEAILLARESHYPATIAELYDADKMPVNLREAHGRNDETLERIYIGRRFRNDTERLEKLFEMYATMTSNEHNPPRGRRTRG